MEKPQKKKQKSQIKQITALVILGLIVIGALFNISVGGTKDGKPKASLTRVLNGQFSQDYEQYRSQNIRAGKILRTLDGSIQTLLGKRESNGIYHGKDHYLMEEIRVPEDETLKHNIAAIQEFDNIYYNIPTYFMLVPNAANILSDKLPGTAIVKDQKKLFVQMQEMLGSGIYWVDVQNVFEKHRKEELYYHTDSRWTTLGMRYGCEELEKTMGIDTSKAPKMKSYVVNNDFTGDLAKKSGYEEGFEESIYIYTPEKTGDNVKLVVTNMDTQKQSATLYDSTKLATDNKYDLFLGGDCSLMNIKTTAETTDRLLIFKDSYANALIPMLVPYYREIVIVDTALYKGKVQKLMESTNFTSVLFLYNGNSFVQDKNIQKVLTAEKVQEGDNTDASE